MLICNFFLGSSWRDREKQKAQQWAPRDNQQPRGGFDDRGPRDRDDRGPRDRDDRGPPRDRDERGGGGGGSWRNAPRDDRGGFERR